MRLWLCLFLAGCAGAKSGSANLDGEGGVAGGDSGDTGQLDSGAEDGVQHWRLDADLELVDGDVDLSASTLSLVLLRNGEDDLDRDGEPDCVDQVVPTQAADVAELPHETVIAWWDVAWDGSSLSCFGASSLPAQGQAFLGVGDLHSEVRALLGQLDEVEDDAAAKTLNSAYAQLPGDDRLLVFGTAGTVGAYDGSEGPAQDTPLQDGSWMIRAVYAFSLD